MSKEACAIVLDVSPSMGRIISGSSSGLDTAKNALRLLIQQKLLFTKQDEIALVLVNTAVTDNPLNTQDSSGYHNVQVIRPLGKPDLALLELLDTIDCADSVQSADVIDGLLVAMQIVHQRVGKLKFTKRIFLISDGESPILDDSSMDTIISGIKTAEFKINIIGVNFRDDQDEEDEDGDKTSNHVASAKQETKQADAEAMSGGTKSTVTRSTSADDRSLTAQNNERFLREFADRVDGMVFTVHSAIDILGYFRSRAVNQVTKFRGPLQIGDIKINVYAYGKTKVMTMPTLKKAAISEEDGGDGGSHGDDGEEGEGGGGDDGVAMERTYWTKQAEDEAEVNAEMRVKSFRYGTDQIPFTEDDIQFLKYQCDKCLIVLAFVDASQIGRHHLMGEVDCIVAEPGDMMSGRALSAFIHALYETNKVALVRYVKRRDARPFLGVLTPEVTTAVECLFYNQLPFAEDIRDWNFAGFSLDSKAQFNDTQLAAAKALIKSMDLMTATTDDDGRPIESLHPKRTFNPALQHFYQTVQQRALDPSAPVGELDPRIAKYTMPDTDMLNKALPQYNQFKAVFPLQPIEKAAKGNNKRHWRDYYDVQPSVLDVDLANVKRAREGEDESAVNTGSGDGAALSEFKFDDAMARQVDRVGGVDPVADFTAILRRRDDAALIARAFDQIGAVIRDFIMQGYGSAYYQRALDCIIAFRLGAVQMAEAILFNSFLTELKALCTKKYPAFWQFLRQNGIRPIDSTEVADSNFTGEAARAFYDDSNAAPSMSVSIGNSDRDTDDIFDSMT